MRGLAVLIVSLLCVGVAQAVPMYPDGALALEAQLLAKMGPGARAWIRTEARREVTIGFYSADTQTQAALRYGAPAADYPALSFLILMQAARDAEADVHSAVDSRNMAATQVAREDQLASGINKFSKQDELSSGSDIAMQQGSAPTLLSSKLRTQDPTTAGTTHPNDVAAAPPPPPKPVDMQKVMDRESDVEDTLASAAKLMTPAAAAATKPMG